MTQTDVDDSFSLPEIYTMATGKTKNLDPAGRMKFRGWLDNVRLLGMLPDANGENIKTAQQTLGHANSQITANVYTQAVPSAVRSAHDRIVDMVIAVKAPAKVALLLSGPKWPQIPDADAVSC